MEMLVNSWEIDSNTKCLRIYAEEDVSILEAFDRENLRDEPPREILCEFYTREPEQQQYLRKWLYRTKVVKTAEKQLSWKEVLDRLVNKVVVAPKIAYREFL